MAGTSRKTPRGLQGLLQKNVDLPAGRDAGGIFLPRGGEGAREVGGGGAVE